jgi:ComF family protein
MEPPFAKAAAYGSYEGGLRDLIHLLKYQQVRPAARVLGRMLSEVITGLAAQFGPECPSQEDKIKCGRQECPPYIKESVVMVPVPLHPRKLKQRGFNQAELIAQEAVKLAPDLQLEVAGGVMIRCRETASQIGLSRRQRRENMRGAFEIVRPETIAARTVLLVDDVFTTGTTVSECARVLRRAGAGKVLVATVARTLKLETAGVPLEEPAESALAMAAAR